MKKTTIGGSAVALGGLAGCTGGSDGDGSSSDGGSSSSSDGSGGGNSGNDDNSGLLTITRLSNSYWESVRTGWESSTEAFSYSGTVELNEGNLNKQFQQVDTAIAGGTNAIVGQAFQDNGVKELGRAAVDAGVPCVQFWTISPWLTPADVGDEWVQFHMPNLYENAYTNAVVLFEAMGGSGNFVHIEGQRGQVSNAGRNRGLEAALEEYPDIERLNDPIPGNLVRSDSRKAMADLISRFGDDIEGFFAQNDGVALGGLTSLEENDLNVPTVGIDGSRPALEAVQEGRMTATISALGPWQAGWSLAKCYDYNNGWEPDDAERMMVHPGIQIVSDPSEWEDIDERDDLALSTPEVFIEEMYTGETPYDWRKMSVVENPDSWDPQNKLEPITETQMRDILSWTEDNRPSDYELPDAFKDGSQKEEVRQRYADQFQNNPFE